MCLMLYIGCKKELPVSTSPDLRVEYVDEARQCVLQWFSLPTVRFIGAHTGCSCGFPSVISESPIECYSGMPLESDERAADLLSVRALLSLLGEVLASGQRVELYPAWDGDEGVVPKGVISWQMDQLEADQLFFNEGFMHVVHGSTKVV